VQLLNAAHMRNVPGRKTDVSDAAWIAQLVEHGLVRPSFVPPPPIRRLRDLTRYRSGLTGERTREKQRLEKVLEDAGIKLSVIISDVFGVSGRAMLAALIAGERDPRVPMATSCRALGVSQAWYYKWRDGDPSPRPAGGAGRAGGPAVRRVSQVARLFAAYHGRTDHRGSPRS